jgi:hypothetical protein
MEESFHQRILWISMVNMEYRDISRKSGHLSKMECLKGRMEQYMKWPELC